VFSAFGECGRFKIRDGMPRGPAILCVALPFRPSCARPAPPHGPLASQGKEYGIVARPVCPLGDRFQVPNLGALTKHESRHGASVPCVTRVSHWHAQVKGVEYAWTNCSGSDCALVTGFFCVSRFDRPHPYPACNRDSDAPPSFVQR
jgi:hypothetical protein